MLSQKKKKKEENQNVEYHSSKPAKKNVSDHSSKPAKNVSDHSSKPAKNVSYHSSKPAKKNLKDYNSKEPKKNVNQGKRVEKAWGMIYMRNNDKLKYFVTSRQKSFKLKYIARTAVMSGNSDQIPKGVDYNMKLFTVKSFLKKNVIVKIQIGPILKSGLIVDGKLIKKPKEIRGSGRSMISIPNHKDVHFIFEAFCDVSKNANLKQIRREYRILSVLGKGGFGEVYKAVSVRTEDFCAVKTELIAGAIDTAAVFQLVSQMDHPGIIKYTDYVVKSGGHRYLIMEFAHGGTLNTRINEKNRIAEQPARHILKQIFAAVSYLHNEKDIVHRDIKPQNIVCMSNSSSKYCVAKLIDFGLACRSASGEMKRVAGHRSFMPPEMLFTEAYKRPTKFTKAIDVWCLGVTLFVTLTGQLPFTFEGDVPSFLQRILVSEMNTDTPYYERLSDDAKLLIHSCLTVRQGQRPPIDTALKYKWFRTTT